MSDTARTIDQIIRDALVAPLKTAGFRKDGRTFRRRDAACTAVVNVQGSPWNAAKEGSFTLNLGVYFPAVVPYLDWARVTDRPTEADCQVTERIGFLMPVQRDYWWKVTLETDLSALSNEVRQAWDQFGAPFIESHQDLHAAREFAVRKGFSIWAAAVSLALNEAEEARRFLNDTLTGWPEDDDGAESLREWGRRHGLLREANS